MLVGNKDRFAIEFELDEFFDNSFVAFGTYRIYVNGFCYGEKSPEPSWFGGVVYGFKELIEEKRNYENFFSEYSDMEIIKTYWHYMSDNPFPTPEEMLEEDNKDFLGIKGKEFKNSFFNFNDRSEAHLDDGSNILLFSNDEIVKLLGYRDLGLDETDDVIVGDVNSVIIPREEFDNIIRQTLDTILSERDKAIKEGRV